MNLWNGFVVKRKLYCKAIIAHNGQNFRTELNMHTTILNLYQWDHYVQVDINKCLKVRPIKSNSNLRFLDNDWSLLLSLARFMHTPDTSCPRYLSRKIGGKYLNMHNVIVFNRACPYCPMCGDYTLYSPRAADLVRDLLKNVQGRAWSKTVPFHPDQKTMKPQDGEKKSMLCTLSPAAVFTVYSKAPLNKICIPHQLHKPFWSLPPLLENKLALLHWKSMWLNWVLEDELFQ